MTPPLGRMTGEEISLLLFQTMRGIEEDLKEFEWEETCTSVGTSLEENPSCTMEEDNTVEEEALASTSHRGMIKNSSIVISAHCMKISTSLHDVDLEQ